MAWNILQLVDSGMPLTRRRGTPPPRIARTTHVFFSWSEPPRWRPPTRRRRCRLGSTAAGSPTPPPPRGPTPTIAPGSSTPGGSHDGCCASPLPTTAASTTTGSGSRPPCRDCGTRDGASPTRSFIIGAKTLSLSCSNSAAFFFWIFLIFISENKLRVSTTLFNLIAYKAQVGTTAFLGSRASLPAWTTAGLRPSAGWKPALPGGRDPGKPRDRAELCT